MRAVAPPGVLQVGLSCRIRTCDPQLRRLLLYPAELRTVTWYPRADSNRHAMLATDFKSVMSTIPSRGHWWAYRDLNSEPTVYETGALTN